jgi:hypothetical protein
MFRSSHGFMHMRIQLTSTGQYILGQFRQEMDIIIYQIYKYSGRKRKSMRLRIWLRFIQIEKVFSYQPF